MKKSKNIGFHSGISILFTWILFLLAAATFRVSGQEPPPRPIIVTVSISQYLSFGAFYQGGSGGSVIISSTGSRSSTGDVVLLNMGYPVAAGLFDITGNPGTLISIINGPDVLLTGSNGGIMTLKIGASSPLSPFVITTTPPTPTQLLIGGTLIVGSPGANVPGNYSGSFSITFVQE